MVGVRRPQGDLPFSRLIVDGISTLIGDLPLLAYGEARPSGATPINRQRRSFRAEVESERRQTRTRVVPRGYVRAAGRVAIGQALGVIGSAPGIRVLTQLLDPSSSGEVALGLSLAGLNDENPLPYSVSNIT